MPAGKHDLLVENPGPDWIAMSGIDLGIEEPVLASIGRRNNHFISSWVWHRTNLYTLNPTAAGRRHDGDRRRSPAGSWKVTWWDTLNGVPLPSSVVSHPGGLLKVASPKIALHAAVVLVRMP